MVACKWRFFTLVVMALPLVLLLSNWHSPWAQNVWKQTFTARKHKQPRIDISPGRCYGCHMAATLSTYTKDEPSDARQIRSRKALTDALLALLEEKPFDQITIREISARAKIGYATFFRHYPTKEALLGDIAAEEIAKLISMTTPLMLNRNSEESTRLLCAYVDEHRKLWSALLTGGAAGLVREEFIRQLRDVVMTAQLDEHWLPADLTAMYGAGATFDLLAWWLAQEKPYPLEEIASIISRLVIEPLVRK